MDFDFNEGFYEGLEREHDRKKEEKYVRLQFKELCLQNEYTAEYMVKSKMFLGNRGYVCTMRIKCKDGMLRYYLTSDGGTTSKGAAILRVMSKIVNQSKGISGGTEKRVPFEDSGRSFEATEVNKL